MIKFTVTALLFNFDVSFKVVFLEPLKIPAIIIFSLLFVFTHVFLYNFNFFFFTIFHKLIDD